jgi:hypothetical protein
LAAGVDLSKTLGVLATLGGGRDKATGVALLCLGCIDQLKGRFFLRVYLVLEFFIVVASRSALAMIVELIGAAGKVSDAAQAIAAAKRSVRQ